MPWNATTLAGALGGLVSSANAAIDQIQAQLSRLDAQVNKLNSDLNTAVGAVSSAKSTIGKLSESGFYMITLEPKQGSWSGRLGAAQNSPPSLAYSCGVATIITAADLATATTSYDRIVEAATKPMTDTKSIYDQFDFNDYVPDPDPEALADLTETQAQDWSDIFTSDIWKSSTLGDVFGGMFEGMTTATNALSKDARSVQAGINQVKRAEFAINKGLGLVQTLLTRMAETGLYTISLAPAAGNYLSRLQSEENAPDDSSSLYTAGYVCITVGATAESLADKFATLSEII